MAATAAPSRVVKGLRWLLPAGALALFALLMIWPQIRIAFSAKRFAVPSVTKEMAEKVIRENRLSGATYTDKDAHNRPYTITAAEARLSTAVPDAVEMERPTARLDSETTASVTATAQHGFYIQAQRKLVLNGAVELTHADAKDTYHLMTEAVQLNIADDTAHTDRAVHISSSTMDIRGQGLLALSGGAVLILGGPATAQFQGEKP